MKESNVSGVQNQMDLLDKTSQAKRDNSAGFAFLSSSSTYVDPFDKLICSDQLSYLPNLYLRQYKLMEDLIRLRQDFPEQKILLPRANTTWDNIIDQAKVKSQVLAENKKYKIAQKFQLVRSARLEVQRKQLRNQQQYHFHRILGSSLAEAVVIHFQQQKGTMQEENNSEQKVIEKSNPVKKNQDDIFVDGGDDYSYLPQENNLIDDLLNENVNEEVNNQVEKEQVHIEPISQYVKDKYREDRDYIDLEPQMAISRKGSLRRINQNVRKRLRIKEEEDQQPGRSLSSATVFLSNLMNIELESKCQVLVQLPNQTEWLYSSEKQRKKKDDDIFQLRWSTQQIERMQGRNERFNIRKGKMDNNILVLSMNEEEQQYRRYFQKNYASQKSFPPTLRNVPELKMVAAKRYYNQFHDKQYQLFIMRFNKRKIFKQFADNANFIFPQNYSHDELQQNQTVNTGKIFVHPPHKVLNRIIYKISDYKLTVSVRNQLKVSVIDIDRMILMTFLAKKYLSKFGNVWKSITQFISMSQYFSNIYVTQQLVQQVYQLISKYQNQDNHLAELQLWDKKILPYNYYGSNSYTEFDPSLHVTTFPVQDNKIEAEIDSTDDEGIDFDKYQSLILEPVKGPRQRRQAISQQFQNFSHMINKNVSKLHLNNQQKNREQQRRKIKSTLAKFKPSEDVIECEFSEDEADGDLGSIHNFLSENMKVEIKVGSPFRKKKNINERNNQLVKILQALRNKSGTNAMNTLPKKVDDNLVKPANQASVVKPSPAVVPPSAQKPVEVVDPKKPIPKSPINKLGAPSKNKDNRKNNKDGEDKK